MLEGGVLMDVFPDLITLLPGIFDFEPATVMQPVANCARGFLCCLLMFINGWRLPPLSEILQQPIFKWRRLRSFLACASAIANLCIIFGNLLMVDIKRYSSMGIILFILLVFVVALLVILTVYPNPKDRLGNDDSKADDDGSKGQTEKEEVGGEEGKKHKLGDISTGTTEDHISARKKKLIRGGRGEEESRRRDDLLLMVLLPRMLLCVMRYFGKNMEMTNCLLYLTCSLGELALMMASLASEFDLAPVFEVVRRAFLVTGLLTAHAMAAELLGEFVVLVFMPELVAALAWITIYIDCCDDAVATSTVEGLLRIVDLERVLGRFAFRLISLAGIVLACVIGGVPDTDDEAEAAVILMPSAAVLLSSVILPSLCMLALRQWRGQTTAAPSSELKGAIQLLSFCRDGLWNKVFTAVFLLPAEKTLASKLFGASCILCALVPPKSYYGLPERMRALLAQNKFKGGREKQD